MTNKHIERISELYKEVSANSLLASLPFEQKLSIAHSAFIEENHERRGQEIEANNERRHQERLHDKKPWQQKTAPAPAPQPTIPGLGNMTKDLKGTLVLKKETEKGSILLSIGNETFWVFPSALKIMTDAKMWYGCEVQARIQERKWEDGKKYWSCIGLSVNPGDDIP